MAPFFDSPFKPRSLRGIFDKLKRAKFHLDQINSALDIWDTSIKNLNPVVIGSQPNWKVLEVVVKDPPAADESLSLMLGDYVHNLRSCLDHLVAQLSVLNGHKIGVSRLLAFPICKADTDWNSQRYKVANFLSPDAVTAINREQPYHALASGRDPLAQILWVLSELDNIDKHRVIVVTSQKVRGTAIRIYPSNGGPLAVELSDHVWRPLEDGAVLGTINAFGSNGPPEIDVEMDLAAAIQIDETGLCCDGWQLRDALPQFFDTITGIIDRFNRGFFSSEVGQTDAHFPPQ